MAEREGDYPISAGLPRNHPRRVAQAIRDAMDNMAHGSPFVGELRDLADELLEPAPTECERIERIAAALYEDAYNRSWGTLEEWAKPQWRKLGKIASDAGWSPETPGDIPEGEPTECDGIAWDKLPPVVTNAEQLFIECRCCGGSGFTGPETSYGGVCGECAGQKFLPWRGDLKALREAAQALADYYRKSVNVGPGLHPTNETWLWLRLRKALASTAA